MNLPTVYILYKHQSLHFKNSVLYLYCQNIYPSHTILSPLLSFSLSSLGNGIFIAPCQPLQLMPPLESFWLYEACSLADSLGGAVESVSLEILHVDNILCPLHLKVTFAICKVHGSHFFP